MEDVVSCAKAHRVVKESVCLHVQIRLNFVANAVWIRAPIQHTVELATTPALQGLHAPMELVAAHKNKLSVAGFASTQKAIQYTVELVVRPVPVCRFVSKDSVVVQQIEASCVTVPASTSRAMQVTVVSVAVHASLGRLVEKVCVQPVPRVKRFAPRQTFVASGKMVEIVIQPQESVSTSKPIPNIAVDLTNLVASSKPVHRESVFASQVCNEPVIPGLPILVE